MRLQFATKDLTIDGICYEGFPLLLDDSAEPMQPAQDFLWALLTSTAGLVEATWHKYGRDVYDYFAFLYRNKISWKQVEDSGVPSALSKYSTTMRIKQNLSASTIRGRVALAKRLYVWAHNKGFIERQPFEIGKRGRRGSPDDTAALDVFTEPQVTACVNNLTNETHALVFELMCRSGMRQTEVRSLPDKYVFDPTKRPDLDPRKVILVKLDPKDMKTKGSKIRTVEIPYSLMQKMFWWSTLKRPARLRNAKTPSNSVLFITEAGRAYGASAFRSIFRCLAVKVGFAVRPHMCRHTYATHRIISLQKSATFKGNPILYVMDRLGHSTVIVTLRYTKHIELLSGQLIYLSEDELDRMFSSNMH